jgi:hypothetical protein
MMSYHAKVFNVMIASPNDVMSERSIIREVIYEWNSVHSKRNNIVLLPIGWESHSSPEMGEAPQAIINRQVLDKGDLLVGIFWTRIGTRTIDYKSGTVEEIEKHMASGKPTMLYFSERPVAPESLDAQQYQELKSFKSSCKDRGLYEPYDSHSDFKQKFYRHLQIKINEHHYFENADLNNDIHVMTEGLSKQLPELSEVAKILLKEASLDDDGSVLHVRYIGGTDIETNGKNMIAVNERREVAKWESALEELVGLNLLVARGYKGEVYEITELGYQIADTIQI